MSALKFRSNNEPTLGVELELALVDSRTGALTSAAPRLLERIPEEFASSVKPELMQCYIEINSGVGRTVDEVGRDLAAKLEAVEEVAEQIDARLYWSATHPFSRWEDQTPTDQERYLNLLKTLQDMGRQLVTFGLHVHVGVDSGDKAVAICDRILRRLPLLLALSANSPWWNGRESGLLSHRSKIMEGLPTAGLPPLMRNWSEYVWLVSHLEDTAFINSIRDIWWVVRPHHNFGTVEVRVCDMPGRLDDALAIAAVIQSLVTALSDEIDAGTYQHDCHPMLVRQNLWRAERYGLDAELIDPFTHEARPARDTLTALIDRLGDAAENLGCAARLEDARRMASGPTWAERQLRSARDAGGLGDHVLRAAEASRVRPRETARAAG